MFYEASPSPHNSDKKTCADNVVIASLPDQDPAGDGPNPFGFSSPNLGRILMWCCGPRNAAGCIPGSRTVTPCVHVMTALHLAGVLAHDPNEHWRCGSNRNYLKASDPLPGAHGRDILQGDVG